MVGEQARGILLREMQRPESKRHDGGDPEREKPRQRGEKWILTALDGNQVAKGTWCEST
jgi:hypothetical protein